MITHLMCSTQLLDMAQLTGWFEVDRLSQIKKTFDSKETHKIIYQSQ